MRLIRFARALLAARRLRVLHFTNVRQVLRWSWMISSLQPGDAVILVPRVAIVRSTASRRAAAAWN